MFLDFSEASGIAYDYSGYGNNTNDISSDCFIREASTSGELVIKKHNASCGNFKVLNNSSLDLTSSITVMAWTNLIDDGGMA